MQLDGSHSTLSPVVHGDTVLSINTNTIFSKMSLSYLFNMLYHIPNLFYQDCRKPNWCYCIPITDVV